MALEAVLQEIPDAFLAHLLRFLVGLANDNRHQNPHAMGLIALIVFSQHLLEDLLGLRGGGPMAARGQEVAVAVLGNLAQGALGATRGDPDGWMRILGGLRPRIYIS